MSDNAQGPAETWHDRMERAPRVLRSYARDLDKYGYALDSGLPAFLKLLAADLETPAPNRGDGEPLTEQKP